MPNVQKGCKILKSLSSQFQISVILSVVCHGNSIPAIVCEIQKLKYCDNLSIQLFVDRTDNIAAAISSSSPPVCLELHVPSVMSVPKMETFPLQSRQVGEKVPRQTSAATPGSNDLSLQPAK
jgi:hypothetical protein